MADKNIQITQRNADNTGWDNLYPKTKTSNIIVDDGSNLQSHLADFANRGLTASPKVATGDWDNYMETGFYAGADLAHAPCAGWCYVEIISSGNVAYAIQRAYSYFNNKDIFTRIKNNGAWSDWFNLFQSVNDGKTAIASAITAQGVSASPTEAFSSLADKIGQLGSTLKAGDILLINEDNIVTESQSVNGRIVKEIKIGYGGTIRVAFDLKCTGGVANGRIFVNGVAKGINRSTTSQSYVTFTEDISINEGDVVQLDLFNQNGMVDNQNFKISIDYGIAQIIK